MQDRVGEDVWHICKTPKRHVSWKYKEVLKINKTETRKRDTNSQSQKEISKELIKMKHWETSWVISKLLIRAMSIESGKDWEQRHIVGQKNLAINSIFTLYKLPKLRDAGSQGSCYTREGDQDVVGRGLGETSGILVQFYWVTQGRSH